MFTGRPTGGAKSVPCASYIGYAMLNTKHTPLVEDMVANLVQAFGGTASQGSHGIAAAEQATPFTNNFYRNDYQRLKERDTEKSNQDRPNAYLNFVLFDEQFHLVEENSGVRRIKSTPDQLQVLGVDKMPIEKNGFLYAYTSNESQQDVFFDDVTVLNITGPVLEETHYYPFGLTMTGISSNILSGLDYPENQHKYNSIEQIGDLGLEDYTTEFRELDPQIGRWWQPDPKMNEYYGWSPYNANLNNPVKYTDPQGDCPTCPIVDMMLPFFTSFWYSMQRQAGDYAVSFQNLSTGTSGVLPEESGISGFSASMHQSAVKIDDMTNMAYAANDYYTLNLNIASLAGFDVIPDLLLAGGDAMKGDYAGASLSLGGAVIPWVSASVLKVGGKAVAQSDNLWKVGTYSEIKGLQEGLDAHHVGQKAVMKKLIPGYDLLHAPAILVPEVGHTIGNATWPVGKRVVSRSGGGFTNARQVVARDILELRRMYPQIPNSALLELIQLNKTMYPGSFVKPVR